MQAHVWILFLVRHHQPLASEIARYSNYPGLTYMFDATLQGCITTGHVGILRAVAPRIDTAEQRPSTPFPWEEMAWTAIAAIHIVARILGTNLHHLNPVRRLAEPFSTAMLALDLP